MNHLVSCSQSAFVPGRSIFDNVIVAHEVAHSTILKKSGKMGFVGAKLDMSKAYDRIEWQYVKAILTAMGFSNKWIDIVMKCIGSVSYSLVINGSQCADFKPSRGLRQGDPLSPYLFILCAEGLSRLIEKAEQDGKIRGFKVTRSAPSVSHLLFADDSLLFFRAREGDYKTIIEVLKTYEKASGQLINFNKSGLMFSSNLINEEKEKARQALGIFKSINNESYLGAPLVFGRNRGREFALLVERIKKRIRCWSVKFLSVAGKEILIKSVAQSIPQYLMSCFLVPKRITHEIDMTIARYWWGDTNEKRKIHWKAWSEICQSKLDGGLGFKSLNEFNHALLGKQWWRIIHGEDLLSYRILKAKYFPHSRPCNAQKGRRPSYLWRSLMMGKKVVDAGSVWRVGDGNTVDIWTDRWIPKPPDYKVTIPNNISPTPMKVATLMNKEEAIGFRSWNEQVLNDVIHPDDRSFIKQIHLSKRSCQDRLIWIEKNTGEFTVKSAYWVARRVQGIGNERSNREKVWQYIWIARVAPCVKNFWWRVIHNILPVTDNLQLKQLTVQNICCVCESEGETEVYCLLTCPFSRKVWEAAGLIGENSMVHHRSHIEIWSNMFQFWKGKNQLDEALYVGWFLWRNRNNKFHKNQTQPPEMIYNTAKKLSLEYFEANHRPSPPEDKVINWTCPPEGHLKLNVDAAFHADLNSAHCGFVIRDGIGSVKLSGICKFDATESVLKAELRAILFGLEAAHQNGLKIHTVESDSKVAVSEVSKGLESSLACFSIIMDILFFTESCDVVQVVHVNRAANDLAHRVAKVFVMGDEPMFWHNMLPESV